MRHPTPFLNVVVHDRQSIGDHLALCAGFERGKWRKDQLADHIMSWLPEFALTHSELADLGYHNAVEMTRKAARLIYQSPKYGNRGEFGELLLHIAIRQVYRTIPAVSKIYYKSAVNKTVEGFDAVHIVENGPDLELWIGETKFYDEINRAIRDVCDEIIDHLQTDYLRNEFILIGNKVDRAWPHADDLLRLIDEGTSLDEIFARACIPVLLTYDSPVVGASAQTDAAYLSQIRTEVQSAFQRMRRRLDDNYQTAFGVSLPVTVHVILVPLESKLALVDALDVRLKAKQI